MISSFSSGVAWIHSQQKGHTLRTNLCPITNCIAGVRRYDSIPIFINLDKDSTAELVCSVVNTKCHVNDALIDMFAVSFVLVSHTRIMSGSCLKIAFNPSS
jgi:hypothetical protein